MKIINSKFYLAFFLLWTAISPSQTFEITLGGTNDDIRPSVTETLDGNYFVTGSSYSYGTTPLLIAKINPAGILLWSKTIDLPSSLESESMAQTSDSGFVIAGIEGPNCYMIKMDKNGTLQWYKNYGGGFGYCVQQTRDGGYILSGNGSSPSANITKTDAFGNIVWQKNIIGPAEGLSIRQTMDGGYIATGYSNISGFDYDTYLLKLDAVGNISWAKTYGTTIDINLGFAVKQTSDKGYIVTGRSNYFSAADDIFVFKTDSSGNLTWAKIYNGTSADEGVDVIQANNGTCVIGGVTRGYGHGNADLFLMDVDTATGGVNWAYAYGGAQMDYIDDFTEDIIRQTADGGFIFSGNTKSTGAGLTDYYIIKTNGAGRSFCNELSFSPIVLTPTITATSRSFVSSNINNITSPVPVIINVSPVITKGCSSFLIITKTNISCNPLSPGISGNDGVATATVTGGTAPFTYVWNPGGYTTQTISGLSFGIYTVSVTDASGTITAGTVSIGQPTAVSIAFITTSVICNGNSNGTILAVASGGTPGYNYSWHTGSVQNTISNLSVGNYTLTVTDSKGCSYIAVTTIVESLVITASISTTTITCSRANGLAMVSASGGTGALKYLWNTGATQFLISNLQMGNYTVTVIDANGCSTIVSTTINLTSTPTVVVSTDITIMQGESTILSATPSLTAVTYLWSPEISLNCSTCSSTVASPMQTTIYCVTITDNNGCTTIACVNVQVDIICAAVFIPTAFSPNNDNENDLLCISGGNQCIERMIFFIYDRWGERVYSSTNIDECWNGISTSNLFSGGKPMNTGIFTWIFNATFKNKETVHKTGNISLIR